MRKKLRNALAIGMLMTLTVMSGVASASPLQSVVASAFGAEATGAVPLGPIAPTRTTFPPSADVQSADLLRLPVPGVLFTGTVSSAVQTSNDATLTTRLPADRLTVKGAGARPERYNAVAKARVEGLSIAQALVPPGIGDVLPALIGIGAVESEAAVSCVNGQPVVVFGSRLIGPLTIAGIDLALPVDNLTNQVVDIVNPLAASLVEIRRNVVDTNINGGVSVIALQVRVLGTTVVLNLAQSRVEGGTCAPPAPQAKLLPRTGGGNPILGVMLLALGGLMLLGIERLRKSSI